MKQTNIYPARKYLSSGLQVLPISKIDKKPVIRYKPLYTKPLSFDEVNNYFQKENFNIGILCGQVSNNLLVIDFDNKKSFNEYRYSLSHILKNTITVKTRRGYHIYIRTPRPIFKNPYNNIKNIDIKHNGYVIAPCSIINDFQYEFDFNNNFNIYRLEDINELPFTRNDLSDTELCSTLNYKNYELEKPYGLNHKLFQVLKCNIGGYKSRSEAEHALVTELVNLQWSFEEVANLFKMHAVKGTKFYDKKGADSFKWLANSFDKAQKYLQKNKKEIDIEIDRLYNFALSHDWQGRTALTDKTVFIAILEIAKRSGKLKNIGASKREIAELIGMNHKTAYKALIRNPFLKKTKTNNKSHKINIYNINIDKIKNSNKKGFISPHSYTSFALNVKEWGIYETFLNKDTNLNNINLLAKINLKDIELIKHDLFRYKGLGKAGYKIYITLKDKRILTLQKLKNLTNISKVTLWRKINIMININMITKIKNKYMLIPGYDLDEGAKKLGTFGKGERDKTKHRIERLNYKNIKQ